MSTEDQRKLAESILVKGLHTDEAVKEATDRLGTKRVAILVSAVFTIALERKYTSVPTRDDVAAYAKHLASTYGNESAQAKAGVVEAVIRGQLGETDLLEELQLSEIIPHQILVAYDIFSSLGLDDAGLARFITESLQLASEYDGQ